MNLPESTQSRDTLSNWKKEIIIGTAAGVAAIAIGAHYNELKDIISKGLGGQPIYEVPVGTKVKDQNEASAPFCGYLTTSVITEKAMPIIDIAEGKNSFAALKASELPLNPNNTCEMPNGGRIYIPWDVVIKSQTISE